MTENASISSLSSLDITRNPFESTKDRLNFPGYSPSMFIKQDTPASERKKKSFKWDIDQISILYPAEIEEYPHQDYSSTSPCLRDEDKLRAEKEAEEYFSQSSIVPSPWTPDRSLKRVTFSPLPPTTAYISACNSSGDSSCLSPNDSAVFPRTVGSQTSLSFPADVDLENILGTDYFVKEQEDNKEMSVSSLRRKLFAQCDLSSPAKTKNSPPNTEEHVLKSILKSPKSPNLITSSPLSTKKKSPDTPSPLLSDGMVSPDISPIKQQVRVHVDSNNNITSTRKSLIPMEISFNVMESSDIDRNSAVLPDLSPIHGKDANMKAKSVDDDQSDVSLMVSEIDKEDGCAESELRDEEDELPEVLTMHDLEESNEADDENDVTENSPGLVMEELTARDPRQNQGKTEPKTDTEVETRGDTCMDTGMEITSDIRETCLGEKAAKNVINDVSETGAKKSYTEQKVIEHLKKESSLNHETKRTDFPDEYYRPKNTFLPLDDDFIVMKAMSALRRADRISPPYKAKSYTSLFSSNLNLTSSLKTTNLSIMNTSTLPWQPVGMSTPLQTQPRRVRVYGCSYECDFCGSSIDKSDLLTMPLRTTARSPLLFSSDLESGIGKSSYYVSGDSIGAFGQSKKKLSPVMEDIIRRKEILKATLEAQNGPVASSYCTHSSIPRTHPLSTADRRRLYGKTVFGLDLDNQLAREFRRSSWPSPGLPSAKLTQGSRPLDPPVFLPPAKYPRSDLYDRSNHSAYPCSKIYGRAFKMPIPGPVNDMDTDSGFADWKQNISRRAKNANHNISGGVFGFS